VLGFSRPVCSFLAKIVNPVPPSPFEPNAAEGAPPVIRSGVTAPPFPPKTQASSLITQKLANLQAKTAPAPTVLASMPTDLGELQTQLQEARQSIDQWTQAETAWNGQRRLFKIMTENVSDLIAAVDGNGNRVWNNAAYSNLLGYPTEELAGTHVLNEVDPDDKARAQTALDQAVQTGAAQQVEFRVRRKDGGWIDLKAGMVPVRDATGQVDTVVFVAHDVTEKKSLNDAVALASTQTTANSVIEGMAHDLDQIITGAVGSLSIAKNLNGAQNAVAIRLGEVERALQRARDVLEQLSSISGHADRASTRVSLEPVVQEAIHSVLRGTMVRAECLFPRRLPEVDIDVEAFSHALRNIITNSAQAMDKGVVRVNAEFLSQEQIARHAHLALKHGSYIHLLVQDQGHGMSEKTLAHAFEPYFTTRPGAQGLGLTTALSTMQRLGGTITAESTPGVGTIIHLYLPAIATPSQSGPAATSAVPGVAAKKRRILLMDDEQMILDIVSRMLSHLGYEVKTCQDGSQAIAAFTKAKNQGEPFDVVLMDLVIPNGVGGQDAVHTIRKIDPNAKVIASSGHLDHAAMKEHKKFGFVGVLEKPYKLERLQQVIQEVIETGA
jgi:two-component system cell cycle sensor histidine kinase/response regulator CckA